MGLAVLTVVKNNSTMKQLFTLIALIAGSLLIQAQSVTLPQASPKAKTLQTIGLTDVAVIYHRPSVNDRDIWGALIPYNQVWRAGANENTVIILSDDVEIGGKSLAAGKYGLHMIPGEEECTVIFSKNATSWGSFSYNPSEDALRVTVKPQEASAHHEMLTFSFENVTLESAECVLSWDDLSIPFKIKVNTHEVVVENLRNELRTQPGFTWLGWNQAANYCLRNDVNLQEALTWANRSVFMNPQVQNIATHARLVSKVNGDGTNADDIIVQTIESDLGNHSVTWREYNGLANFVLQNMNDVETAMKWIDKSIEMSPNMTNMMAKVNLLDTKGKKDEAKKLRADALALGSNFELNNYGYQLLFSGDAPGAVQVFEANVKNNPDDPNAWDSLGEGYLNNGQKDKAIEAFETSLSKNPPANVKANSIKLLKQLGVEYEPGRS